MAANVILLLASVVAALGVCELAARLVLPAPLPWLYPQIGYRADADLGFALAPGARGYSADKPVTINERGLRGPLVPFERTPGVGRILVIGDSIGFGFGVADDDVVTTRMAALLATHGRPTEVINASVSAYNTEQEVGYLERDGLRYRPDWVIVAVCWNDLSDKSGDRVSPEGWLLRAGTDDELRSAAWSESPRGYAVRNAIKRVRLLYAAMQGWRAFQGRLQPDDSATFRADVLAGRSTPRTEDGWRRVGAAVHRLKEASERGGFRPLLVAFPVPLAVERSFPQSSYPERLGRIAAGEGIPMLDLAGVFRAHYHGHESLFIPYDGDHPNAAGHDLAAREVVEFLSAAERR
jgi:lysophospholipase L1-like esterase